MNDYVFMRISHLMIEKEEEYFFENERTKQMQVLNFKREFDALKMNEAKTIKDFMTKVMKLMGEELLNNRIIKNVLVVLLENKEDFLDRRKQHKQLYRLDIKVKRYKEGRIISKVWNLKKTNCKENDCQYKEKTPPPIQCKYYNKNGHVEKFCRLKQQEQNHTPQKVNVNEIEDNEEFLFIAKTTRSLEDEDTWFINSGCTQQMIRFVKIGNGDKVAITSGIVRIHIVIGIKYIYEVQLILEIDQNLLSVGQMMQNGYCLLFKEGSCLVTNVESHELVEVEIRKISFPINWSLIIDHEYKISKTELDSKIIKITSLNCNKYFVLLDDFTKITWIYFFEQKYKVIFFIRSLKSLLKLKELSTNLQCIIHLQQNRVVERKN
ncbi:hypothetical protein CR513_54434, partial [Mucuna pruriens]